MYTSNLDSISDENSSLSSSVMESILEEDETSLSSLTESFTKCDVGNNNTCELLEDKFKESNHCCANGFSTSICYNEIEKCKTEVHQLVQYLESELNKFDSCSIIGQPVVEHVAHLEIKASKKKDLEIVVAEFENKRINSPNPFVYLKKMKSFVCDFDQLLV